MKQDLLKKAVFLMTLVFALAQVQAQVFDFETDKGGWDAGFKMTSADLDATTGRNTLKCVRNHNNATLNLDPLTATIDPTTKKFLRLVVKNESNATQFRVRAITTDSNDKTMTFTITANDTDFKTYVFDLDSYATWANATTITEEVNLQFRVGYTGGEGSIFIDEITFLPTPPVATFESYAGAEEADADNPYIIEPNLNGDSASTGWFFGNASVLYNNYSFSDVQKASGDYSIKFDTNGGSTSPNFGCTLGSATAPALSKVIVSGENELTIKVYIDSNPPSKFNTNIQDNDGVVAQQSISWDLSSIPSSQYGTWVTLSQVVNFNTYTNGRLQLRIAGADIPATTPTIMYFDDISIIPFTQVETAGTFGTTPVDWEDTSTWASGVVPGPDDNVLIKDRVNVFSNITVKRLELETNVDRLLIQKSQSLTVTYDLITKGRVELYSDSNEYSSIIPLGTVTGIIRYSRRVTGSPTNDLISPPTTGWTFGNFIANNFNNNNLARHPTTLSERAFGPFDNENGVYVNYDDFANVSTPIVTGKGYRVGRTANGAFNFNGDVETGSISIAVTDETATNLAYGRWNLIGNPYPSYLDFGAFFAANDQEFDADAYQAIYGYDGDDTNGSKWTVWNGFNLTDKIAPGQAFFVRTLVGGGTVNFTPDMRTIGASDDFIAGRSTTPNYLASEFFLSKDGNTFATKLYFAENQTRGLDPGYDAAGFGGNAGSIFTHLVEDNENVEFILQALPYQDFNDVVVPLGVNVTASVQSTIGLNNTTTNIPSNINVYLEDNVTNTWTLLNTSDYTFTPSVTLNGTGRFYIHFSNSVLSVKDDMFSGLNIYTEQSTKQVVIKGSINADTSATIYDIQGRVVLTKELNLNSTTNTIDVNNLFAGIYIVKLQNTSGSISKKVILK